jgi:hypothetical protein
MSKQIGEYLEDEPEMRERFINESFRIAESKGKKIKSKEDLFENLSDYLGTENGERALSKINQKALDILFESSEMRKRLDEYDGDKDYETIKVKSKGDVKTIYGQKFKKDTIVITIKKESHTRNYVKKSGKITVGYNRSKPRRFNEKEINYLLPRINDEPKKVTKDFNTRFKDNPRTHKSISTKIFRLR